MGNADGGKFGVCRFFIGELSEWLRKLTANQWTHLCVLWVQVPHSPCLFTKISFNSNI